MNKTLIGLLTAATLLSGCAYLSKPVEQGKLRPGEKPTLPSMPALIEDATLERSYKNYYYRLPFSIDEMGFHETGTYFHYAVRGESAHKGIYGRTYWHYPPNGPSSREYKKKYPEGSEIADSYKESFRNGETEFRIDRFTKQPSLEKKIRDKYKLGRQNKTTIPKEEIEYEIDIALLKKSINENYYFNPISCISSEPQFTSYDGLSKDNAIPAIFSEINFVEANGNKRPYVWWDYYCCNDNGTERIIRIYSGIVRGETIDCLVYQKVDMLYDEYFTYEGKTTHERERFEMPKGEIEKWDKFFIDALAGIEVLK